VIARSEGETARFTSILTEYLNAPEVTRQRLYLETMEQVLADTNKVVIDVEDGGNSLLYLPIDQLMKQRPADTALAPPAPTAPAVAAEPTDRSTRAVDRDRRGRQ
jgi:membrane protease subunit HflK